MRTCVLHVSVKERKQESGQKENVCAGARPEDVPEVCWGLWWFVAVHCGVLRCVVEFCGVLQCVVGCCDVLQRNQRMCA